jgi:hypothetical protein
MRKTQYKLKKEKRPVNSRPELGVAERKIVGILDSSGGALHIDEIVERAEMDVQDVLVRLLE